MRPVFLHDFNSPFSYLAAMRVDHVLGEVEWRPVAFGFILRHQQRVPWSLGDGREWGIAEIARRARERGLPELRYPEGWPVGSYSLAPLRLILALPQEEQVAATKALYRAQWVDGRPLNDPGSLRAAGFDPALGESPAAKARLAEITDEANARGVYGVPTVVVGDDLFWGDDRLEDAAAAVGHRSARPTQ